MSLKTKAIIAQISLEQSIQFVLYSKLYSKQSRRVLHKHVGKATAIGGILESRCIESFISSLT
jgi:hypothetical protein